MGDRPKKQKNVSSLYENENLKKGEQTKKQNLLSLYENENFKWGTDKKTRKQG
jgi:hypothetical protein